MIEDREAPLVSAVIPVHNGEAFLSDAIESVLAQSYPRLECVVVDDGSTDGSADLVSSYDSIRLVRQAQRGVSIARNEGVRRSHGSLVAFLDADDAWLPEKIERQVAELRPSTQMIYTGMYVTDARLRRTRVIVAPEPRFALRNTLTLEPPVVSVAQTGLITRQAFEAVGGFDPGLSTSADADLVCRVMTKYEVGAVRAPLALYRQHGDQMHLDARAMERDMLAIFGRMFDDRPDNVLNGYRRRAFGNLYATLAAGAVHDRALGDAARYLVRALRWHPGRTAAVAWRAVAT